jgi:hypothetical protein
MRQPPGIISGGFFIYIKMVYAAGKIHFGLKTGIYTCISPEICL